MRQSSTAWACVIHYQLNRTLRRPKIPQLESLAGERNITLRNLEQELELLATRRFSCQIVVEGLLSEILLMPSKFPPWRCSAQIR